MTRTNIDIDDELVQTVMEQNGLTTKREAIDFALRRTVRDQRAFKTKFRSLRGIGYPMSNDELEDAGDS
jgi:Arc/MetJ family transcription regulator